MSACDLSEVTNLVGVGDLLSGSWELTQRIFENLSYREVAHLRSVCKLWADVGAKILERRRKLHYLTVHPHHVPTTQGKVIIGGSSPSVLFEKFFEHIVSKPNYCIGFCNEDWYGRVDVFKTEKQQGNIPLSQYLLGSLPSSCELGLVFASGIIGSVEQKYQGHLLESANSVNQEILSMLCSKEKEEGGRPTKRSRLSLAESLQNEGQEPSNDSSSSSSSSDLESFSKKSCVGYTIEVEARWSTTCDQAEAVTLLLIPHHPGVKLKFFHISEETFFKDIRHGEASAENLQITTEEFNRLTSLSSEDDLKALLLFDVGLDEGFTSAFLQSALVRQKQKLVIGGGVVECFEYGKQGRKQEVNSLSNLGITVCGPNVTAASVIIPKTITNPKDLDDYMKQLKSCNLPEEQSVAFVFTCCGRGYSWYRRRGNPWFDYNNVESKAFRKVFPNTPVFGFFGGGEIGMSFLPKFNESEVETEETPQKKRKKRLFHQFTTVIVLLSFL